MEREVKSPDGITWKCVQAFSGISDTEEHPDAAQVKGEPDTYWVVCTPSGGAQSVRLKLQGEWYSTYSDEEILEKIQAQH